MSALVLSVNVRLVLKQILNVVKCWHDLALVTLFAVKICPKRPQMPIYFSRAKIFPQAARRKCSLSPVTASPKNIFCLP